jgi:hypothetical protein
MLVLAIVEVFPLVAKFLRAPLEPALLRELMKAEEVGVELVLLLLLLQVSELTNADEIVFVGGGEDETRFRLLLMLLLLLLFSSVTIR